MNLLSISTIEKVGFEIIIAYNKMLVKRDNNIYVEGECFGSLYKIIFTCNDNMSANLVCDNDRIWHKRYSQLNYNSLMNNKKVVNGLNLLNQPKNKICEICVLTKQKDEILVCLKDYGRKVTTMIFNKRISKIKCGIGEIFAIKRE